jgi:hypothetical protein
VSTPEKLPVPFVAPATEKPRIGNRSGSVTGTSPVKLKIPALRPVMLVSVTSALPPPFQPALIGGCVPMVTVREALESNCTTAWAGCAAVRKRLKIASRNAHRDVEHHR